jgi:hypothetical protein
VPQIPATASQPPHLVYCADEDVAVRASGDFAELCPDDQNFAGAADGVFAAGVPWLLTSATVNFVTAGVLPRCICRLTGPKPNFKSSGLLFAVDSVSSAGVVLRQKGQPTGIGRPPAPAAGLAGVTFDFPTLSPQIAVASQNANHFAGVDVNLGTRNPSRIYDPNADLVYFTVLLVLVQQYTGSTRTDRGDWPGKLKRHTEDLADVRARLTLKFGPLGQGAAPSGLSTAMFRR